MIDTMIDAVTSAIEPPRLRGEFELAQIEAARDRVPRDRFERERLRAGHVRERLRAARRKMRFVAGQIDERIDNRRLIARERMERLRDGVFRQREAFAKRTALATRHGNFETRHRRNIGGRGHFADQRGRRRDDMPEHTRDEQRRRRFAFRRFDRFVGRNRQTTHRRNRLHIAMPCRRESFAQKTEPAAIDHRDHALAVSERDQIDGDVTRLRILNELILDHVRQRLTQARPLKQRHVGGNQQRVARGDDQHRRVRARQQTDRGAAHALRLAALVEQQKRQIGQLPLFRAEGRIARR